MSDLRVTPLRLPGTYLIRPTPKRDERGYFMRTWDESELGRQGLQTCWLQENQAYSRHEGQIRGLHFQHPPHAETKLVRVVAGAVLDVFVDLRRDSATYGQWDSAVLSAAEHEMVYLPKGFAHGYCTLTAETIVLYKVDAYYAPGAEGGIRWDDETLRIRWPVAEPLLSARDRQLPGLRDFVSPFSASSV